MQSEEVKRVFNHKPFITTCARSQPMLLSGVLSLKKDNYSRSKQAINVRSIPEKQSKVLLFRNLGNVFLQAPNRLVHTHQQRRRSQQSTCYSFGTPISQLHTFSRVEFPPCRNPRQHTIRQLGEIRIQVAQSSPYLLRQFLHAREDIGGCVRELYALEERNDFFLPKDPLVLFPQIDKRIRCLGVPNVRQTGLYTQIQTICNHFNTPSSPHVIVPAPGLAFSHQTKVHGRADGFTVKGQIHAAHGEQRTLGNRHDSVHIAFVALTGLDHLGGGIIIGNVEP